MTDLTGDLASVGEVRDIEAGSFAAVSIKLPHITTKEHNITLCVNVVLLDCNAMQTCT
jgi:hypothetical protein